MKTVRALYAQTRKGKISGVIQIAVCPMTVLAIVAYINIDQYNADVIAALCMIAPILTVLLTIFGYTLGPPYIPKCTMRKLLRHYFNY